MVCCSPPYWSLRDYQVVGQIGLEKSIAEYIQTMVGVFEEVRRVLRPHGVCFVNIGDSYCTQPYGQGHTFDPKYGGRNRGAGYPNRENQPGVKHKDLCLIPERLAIALQSSGWYVRSRIAWVKPAPMPESVEDRPTSAWEHVWLLTKEPRYYWDAEAVRENFSQNPIGWLKTGAGNTCYRASMLMLTHGWAILPLA